MDLTRAVWRKSTKSGGNGGNCVEVTCSLPGIVAVRDSKNPDGPKIVLSPTAWKSFTAGVKTRGTTSSEPAQAA
jgi:hypothetical protein